MDIGETVKVPGGSVQILRSGSRGHFDHGWLNTYHTFSFGDYHDPARMGFRSLRVMNEDWIAGGMGFGTHPHRDMEILTYVLEGTLHHQDSLGNGGPISAGELQRMTAGTGIRHSERNASETEMVHLYQIWLFPEQRSLTPGYEQKGFDPEARRARWQVVASRDGREDSLTIHQDATLFLAKLASGERIEAGVEPDRQGWLQVLQGQVRLGGTRLAVGDGAAFVGGLALLVEAENDSELLAFDLG